MDIIALIFLAMEIGKLATTKGLSSKKWIINLVLAWVLGELIGGYVGIIIFGKENSFSWLLIAWGVALTSYFVIKNHLLKFRNV